MKHELQIIKPYKLKDMIIVVESGMIVVENETTKPLWYLYDMTGKLINKGYGGWTTQAFINANQVARRYIRKTRPLLFRKRKYVSKS